MKSHNYTKQRKNRLDTELQYLWFIKISFGVFTMKNVLRVLFLCLRFSISWTWFIFTFRILYEFSGWNWWPSSKFSTLQQCNYHNVRTCTLISCCFISLSLFFLSTQPLMQNILLVFNVWLKHFVLILSGLE